jgi:hypothetical protein
LEVRASEPVDLNYHHGGLPSAVGAQNFQVFRANRAGTETGEAEGWTYNHAPMLAYWRGRFFVQFLSNPRSEHVAPGRTLLTSSADGRTWPEPKIVFPTYPLPVGGNEQLRARGEVVPTFAVMHQRMGFFVSKTDRLLTLGFYGFSPQPDNSPFDQRGVGRVVREVFADGSFGPIYFIHYNRHAGWNEANTDFPFFERSPDAGFIAACHELRSNHLVVQQWKEEHGDSDPLINLRGPLKAFSFYTRHDGSVIGLWKWSFAGLSRDRGKSWEWLERIPSLETAGGKIWGQRTSDGRYALLYNPSTNNKHRWPLAMVTSDDGVHFSDMRVVAGHVSPTRYAGDRFKDFGQNYVRGIAEGNGLPADGALWFVYSMNKEDIWIGRVPIPANLPPDDAVNDIFDESAVRNGLHAWNLYCPRWSRVEFVADGPAKTCLQLRDADPYDYACAERVFRPSRFTRVEIRLRVVASGAKTLYIELWDRHGRIPVRATIASDGSLTIHHGRRKENVAALRIGTCYTLTIHADTAAHQFEASLNGEALGQNPRNQRQRPTESGWLFLAPADSISRLVFRTGPVRREPNVDSDVEAVSDLPGAEKPLDPTIVQIESLQIIASAISDGSRARDFPITKSQQL